MSDAAFQLWRRACPKDIAVRMPSLNDIKRIRKELNEDIEQELGMKHEDGNFASCSVVVGECVDYLFRLHTSNFPEMEIPNDVILKLSYDGRANGGIDEVMVGIVPMNLPGLPNQSGYSTFPLGIFQAKESEAKQQVNQLTRTIAEMHHSYRVIGGRSVKLWIGFCIDLCSFWTTSGLHYSNGNQFCPCCDIVSERIADVETELDNCCRRTLPGFPFLRKQFVYCSLHASLRITEKLIEYVATPIMNTVAFPPLVAALKTNYGIRVVKPKEKSNRALKVYLQGNNVKKLMALDHSTQAIAPGLLLLYNNYTGDKSLFLSLVTSWATTYQLINQMQDLSLASRHILAQACDLLFTTWKFLFPNGVTPYVHIVCKHSIETIELHGSIGKWSQQGFEHTNRLHKQIFRTGTNHNGGLNAVKTPVQTMRNVFRRKSLLTKHKMLGIVNRVRNRRGRKKRRYQRQRQNQIEQLHAVIDINDDLEDEEMQDSDDSEVLLFNSNRI